MQVLKITLYGEQAHYHVPFTSNNKMTYPLPPYSTVMGLLANILGERCSELFKEDFGLAVVGKSQGYSDEYTWYRNLSESAHLGRFAETDRRDRDGFVEQPGGQVPVLISVLNDVETNIYLYHNEQVLDSLLTNIEKPEKWFNHLHLGRAEDWVVPVSYEIINLQSSETLSDVSWTSADNFRSWLPDPDNLMKCDGHDIADYQAMFEKIKSTRMLITSTYELVEVDYKGRERKWSNKIRNFNHIPVKILNGQIPLVNIWDVPRSLVDSKMKYPVYLAKIDKLG